MPDIAAPRLVDLARSIFVAVGTPDDIAHSVAQSLVNANLAGHDSHGVLKVLDYVNKIRKGTLQPGSRPGIERQTGAVTLVNCHWGFGQPSARFGAQVAGAQARQLGIACAVLRHVNHIGRLTEYAQMLADDGLIGCVMTSGSMFGGSVAPYGGRERVFGTNPIAWGIPLGADRPPLIVDFATSGIANGKVEVALSEGKQLPPNMLLDPNGQPTTDPNAFVAGGALLPFGDFKGSALMLVIEIIPTLLAGFAPASSKEYMPGNPTLMIALSIDAFTGRERFSELAAELLEHVKQVAPQDGIDEVLLPGEVEARAFARRSVTGIPVPASIWEKLSWLAHDVGVSIP